MSQLIEPQEQAAPMTGTGFLTRISGSVWVWIGLVIFLVVTKVISIVFFPAMFADPSQAALFTWPALAIFALLGLGGVLLSERTGFPDAWSPAIPHWKRILLPLAIGMAWALIPIGIDRWTNYTSLVVARHGLAQQYLGFWPSLFGFSAASILVEVVYRLVIIPLLLFLISTLIFKKKYQSAIFWILAILTSALEPLGQLADISVVSGLPFFILFSQQYLFNFAQAAFFRKYGFLAAILVRVGFYFIWHTIYVH